MNPEIDLNCHLGKIRWGKFVLIFFQIFLVQKISGGWNCKNVKEWLSVILGSILILFSLLSIAFVIVIFL